MKIVVLCGGLSTERNISFLTGTKVCRALRTKGHQAVLVDLFMGLEDITEDPASLFAVLSTDQAMGLIADGTISGGMIPKVTACVDAIQKGVKRVHIINGTIPHPIILEIFTDKGIGTMFEGAAFASKEA